MIAFLLALTGESLGWNLNVLLSLRTGRAYWGLKEYKAKLSS